MMDSRYIIGIDLGTTNSCAAYVDTEDPSRAIQLLRIPQLTAEGCVEAQTTLPSFCYLAAAHEWPVNALHLPWSQQSDFFIGRFAQEQGAKVPTRLVQSAKSWLCHASANRRDKILPFEAADAAQRISPVEATAHYLRHIKDAWNFLMGQGDPNKEFAAQEVILTVPASFDEVARSLTIEAAKLAGFGLMTLLEEPQAAFYSWLSQHEKEWERLLRIGDCILACDVGGGTTDFSLMEAVSQGGKATIQRMAVGDHLLLGGDNMDAALAHYLEKKLNARQLAATQWLQLRHQARCAKEKLLDSTAPSETYRIFLQGTGSSVVQGGMLVEAARSEVEELLLNGFFGSHSWEEALQIKKTRGLRSMGLPYEDDPSITKQLAHFLNQCGAALGTPKKPDYILFNGGAMKAAPFQNAITSSLKRWFPEKNIQVLSSFNLDYAVARGASCYGKARRGMGVRIGGGAARSYYLGIDVERQGETTHQALTLLARGCEEGAVYEPDQIFRLAPNTPVVFQLYASHVRLQDHAGDLATVDLSEMQALPPIHTILRFGKQAGTAEKIPVRLEISLTTIGTLALWLKSQKTDHKWSLEFQLRTAAGVENSLTSIEKARTDETFDADYLQAAKQTLKDLFAADPKTAPQHAMESLETLLNRPRGEWPLSVLRQLGDAIMQQAPQRRRSHALEARWWNLLGFFLRPGFGYPLDDFRMKELWKVILGDLKVSKSPDSEIQNWICYRRIAGGLTKGQQAQLAAELVNVTLNKKNGKIEIKSKGGLYPYFEKIRALGALELIDAALKIKLGNALMERIRSGEGCSADYWTLGRLGARRLLYGSAVNVMPREACGKWVKELLTTPQVDEEQLPFLIGQLARKTDQRELNLSIDLIDQILERFAGSPHLERLQSLLQVENALTEAEQSQFFGDALPAGLTLARPA